MIKVNLITLGRLKEKYLSQAVDEYKKRLSRYCALKITEIEPVRLSENPSQTEIDTALSKETALILKQISQNSTVVTLCIEGKQLSSPELAEFIEKQQISGKSIALVIGSSYGLSEEIKRKSDLRLSVSKMTFPHQLFRVMLLEQTYRAFKIIEGSAYHK